jgi:hypothetical protein
MMMALPSMPPKVGFLDNIGDLDEAPVLIKPSIQNLEFRQQEGN